jgi:hypothetical protein
MESISADFQWIGGLVFAVSVAFLAAWSRFAGKKEGPATPKVQEFYAAGQLADMGPVKEMVESVGLVMQQMVRTNIALEETARGIHRISEVYETHLAEERRDKEIAEEVARQLKEKR